MAFLTAATNNIFGLIPVESARGMGQTRIYAVSSTEGVNILIGDGIVQSTAGTVRAALTADIPATRPYVGVAAQSLTTAEYAAGTLNLLVYDAPDQVFVIAESSVGITSTFLGMSFSFITSSTNANIPSTALGRSKHCIIQTAASSAQYLNLIGAHPIESWTSGVGSVAKKWLVCPAPRVASNITS